MVQRLRAVSVDLAVGAAKEFLFFAILFFFCPQ